MKFYADLHLHSRYSRATSKDSDLEHIAHGSQLKGIHVVGTGDFVHPGWLGELKKKLEPAEEGFFRIKNKYNSARNSELPASCKRDVRFMLTAEVSGIYKKFDKVRRIHNLIFTPSMDAALGIQKKLKRIGNISSDGRPILGLDSRDLLEIVLDSDPLSYLIPAHIWTPWFSVLGSKGGFDSIEECFGDLAKHVFALETGLSSDPMMNWRLSRLDRYALVSNSDAHSPGKLGREATIYDTEFSYNGIYDALASRKNAGLAGTIEFFPQEGKYHYDGHRLCGVRMHPKDTIKNKMLCPKCGKRAVVGVMARVEALADHPEGRRSPKWRPYYSLVSLPQIIGEAKGVGAASKAVHNVYKDMLEKLGDEISILIDVSLDDIHKAAGSLVTEGIRRMRKGDVHLDAGYDGEYGRVRIFSPTEREKIFKKKTSRH